MKRLLGYGALLGTLLGGGCAGTAYRAARETDAAILSLEYVYAELKRSYYDPDFRGQDMQAQYEHARLAIERAQTYQQRFQAVRNFLRQLDDSHTAFTAHGAVGLYDYGFNIRFYGDVPFVSAVDTWSFAETAGLRRGDEIVKFNGQTLTRADYVRVVSDFLAQHPIPTLDLEVRTPNRSVGRLVLRADTAALRRMPGRQYRRLLSSARDSAERASRHIQNSIDARVFYWKLPQFADADRGLDGVVARARKHDVLILDLRGNHGGAIKTLEKLVGYFTDEPVEVGTLHMRWDKERYRAKPEKDRFTGKLFILVDSETASAAEVFARLMQIRRRGTVVGDRTAAAVMASMFWRYVVGNGMVVGASITVSDFVLYNGERLEKSGVQPDIRIIPTAHDIAAGVDPVLAYALRENGIEMTSAQAANLIAAK